MKINNKAFTMIELLAVIVILGILISVSTVAVTKIKKNQDEENRKNVISSILTGAKSYIAEHPEKLASLTTTTSESVSVSELYGKYVDFDKNKYSNLSKKKVSIAVCPSSSYKLKYSIEDNNITYNDCGCEKQESGDAETLCRNQ